MGPDNIIEFQPSPQGQAKLTLPSAIHKSVVKFAVQNLFGSFQDLGMHFQISSPEWSPRFYRAGYDLYSGPDGDSMVRVAVDDLNGFKEAMRMQQLELKYCESSRKHPDQEDPRYVNIIYFLLYYQCRKLKPINGIQLPLQLSDIAAVQSTSLMIKEWFALPSRTELRRSVIKGLFAEMLIADVLQDEDSVKNKYKVYLAHPSLDVSTVESAGGDLLITQSENAHFEPLCMIDVKSGRQPYSYGRNSVLDVPVVRLCLGDFIDENEYLEFLEQLRNRIPLSGSVDTSTILPSQRVAELRGGLGIRLMDNGAKFIERLPHFARGEHLQFTNADYVKQEQHALNLRSYGQSLI